MLITLLNFVSFTRPFSKSMRQEISFQRIYLLYKYIFLQRCFEMFLLENENASLWLSCVFTSLSHRDAFSCRSCDSLWIKFLYLNSGFWALRVCVCRFKHLERLSVFSASAGFMGYVCVASVIMGLSGSQRFVFTRRMELVEVCLLTCAGRTAPDLSRAADGLDGTSGHPWLHLKSARSAAVNARPNRAEASVWTRSSRSAFIHLIWFVWLLLLLFMRVGSRLEISEHKPTLLFYSQWRDQMLMHNYLDIYLGFASV